MTSSPFHSLAAFVRGAVGKQYYIVAQNEDSSTRISEGWVKTDCTFSLTRPRLAHLSGGVPQAIGVDSEQERDWVDRARAGNREAFASLVDRYWEPVRAWLTGLTGNAHAAEDLAQEAFVKAWVALPGLAAVESFRVWLFRIARNEYLASAGARGSRSARPPTRRTPAPIP